MARKVTAADVMVSKDAWDVAVSREAAAKAEWDRNPCAATNAAVAVASKAQVQAWRVWNRAEEQAA